MNLAKIAWASVVLVGFVAAGNAIAVDAPSVQATVKRMLPVSAGSPAEGMLRQFVKSHEEGMSHAKAGAAVISMPASASFEMTRVYEVSGADALSRANGRTVEEMLAAGHAGDTVQISTCNDHDSQRWSYAWGSGDWAQRDYEYKRVDNCRGANVKG